MEKLALSSTLRDVAVKTSEIRANKLVPSVVYGHKLAPVHLSVDASEFLRTFRKAGMTHIVDLAVDGKKHQVLIHEVQKHPVTGAFLHIDFFAVNMKEKIHVQIPIVLIGKAQAALEGALVEQNLHHLDVKVLAADLVDSIEVDISPLVKVGDVVHVSDIVANYPKLEVLTPVTEGIVAAHTPKPIRDEEVAAPVIAEAAPAAEAPKAE